MILCYGICTSKCVGYEDGKCRFNYIKCDNCVENCINCKFLRKNPDWDLEKGEDYFSCKEFSYLTNDWHELIEKKCCRHEFR